MTQSESFKQAAAHDNVLFPGLVAYSDLPHYLARFDVALLPFVLSEITLHIHPTKALEYLASKTPVVSTPIPDVVKFYEGIVRISEAGASFVNAIEDALGDESESAIERGFAMAKASSWDRMVQEMRSEFEGLLLASNEELQE